MVRLKIEIPDDMRDQIRLLAAYCLRDDQITEVLNTKNGFEISERSLRTHCRKELNEGRAEFKQNLELTAKQMSLSGKHPVMTIFMCKVHLGWRETQPIDSPNKMSELAKALSLGPKK